MAKSRIKTSAAAGLVANALGLGLRTVPPDARMGEFEPWDSLGHLRIMLELEAALGRQLAAAEAVRIESVEDITEMLDQQPE